MHHGDATIGRDAQCSHGDLANSHVRRLRVCIRDFWMDFITGFPGNCADDQGQGIYH